MGHKEDAEELLRRADVIPTADPMVMATLARAHTDLAFMENRPIPATIKKLREEVDYLRHENAALHNATRNAQEREARTRAKLGRMLYGSTIPGADPDNELVNVAAHAMHDAMCMHGDAEYALHWTTYRSGARAAITAMVSHIAGEDD